MAGLLDFIQTPAGVGLLSAIAGGAAGARRGTPWNNIGRAGLAGLTGYTVANENLTQQEERKKANELRDIQIAEAKRIQGLNSQLGGLLDKYQTPEIPAIPERTTFNSPEAFGAFTPPQTQSPFDLTTPQPTQQRDFSTTTIPGVPGKPAGIDYEGLNRAAEPLLAQLNPVDYLKTKAEEQRKANATDYKIVDGNLVQVGGGQPPKSVFTAPQKVDYNKPFLPDGTPNIAYQEFSKSNSRAGAPNTSIRIDNKASESLAKEIGPILDASASRARAAVAKAQQGDKVLQVLDSGNLITGTGANIRVDALRLGASLGISGKDDNERLANTQQAIKALASITLEARQKLKGSGAITDKETDLLARAESGDINFTVPELRRLVELNREAAQIDYDNHQRLLNVARGRPEGALAPYFEAPPLPDRQKPKQQSGVRKYNPATGRIE